MSFRRTLSVAAVGAAVVTAAVLPVGSAHAFPVGPCSDWETFNSYYGPGGNNFNHMATRVCIAMSPYTSGGEKFAGKATIYNGPAFSGYYNNHLGARYVQFGTPGGDAMVGLKMGYSDAYKVIKGKFGHPTNDCYRGELMPGYSVSCESAWTLDNSPSSPNQIMASIKVKATFWDGYSWWEGNGNEIDYSPLLG